MSVLDANSPSVSQTPRVVPEPLLTAGEVAAIFQVTDRTVWRWANDGCIHRIRVGGVTRFTAESVTALIDAGGERA
jgi:excisionase family DNA binding protein